MFERFTERARQVVVLAQEEAHRTGYGQIGPDHILLGLLLEEEGLAARVLASCGVTLDAARAVMVVRHPATEGQIPFTPDARKVLEASLREALNLGHNYIGTEHILLAFFNPVAVAAGKDILLTILQRQGKTGDDLRAEIRRLREPERVDQGVDWGPTNSQVTITPRRVLPSEQEVTVTLHRDHVVELLRLVGERPHSEVWSREIFTQLREALKGSQVDV